DERVLIPRPETEILILEAKKYITTNSKVLDLCTGSGALAIAISKECNIKVKASDISYEAITLAKENALMNNAEVDFIESDLFSNLKEEKFDVIVSNPPYIKSDDIDNLQKEVKDFEPRVALDGGVDGLDFYRKIANEAKKHLNKDGVLLLECGISQAEEIKTMFDGYSKIEIIKDLEKIDRVVKVVL
ncbi:MAG: peptide chain release factor N(5)-glutamine methyltransferase, partial [Firmicutes bacterium]|nr:peptide chain release factor N(5)-glutamine methyltransferase [Candidatus Caballimonas caccae]